jgi:outer membrane protein assembly factor BamA
VHDKSLFGYVGPFAGARDRFELSPSFGTWRYDQGLVDMRRYFFARPFTLAIRGMFLGRIGRDGDRFPIYLGTTELIRGYTAGSVFNNECAKDSVPSGGYTGCATLDQLIGSRIAVANIELRFPLARNFVLGFLPVGFPPIEGALFYDAGIAWQSGDTLTWKRAAGANPAFVRAPLKSYGASIRANVLGFVILRFDYTKPVDRPGKHPYWTVSLGPTF